MDQDGSPTDVTVRIRRVAEKVLQDESFRRAPVMARLLQYLVERTVQGIPVKSYTIAIDALGKPESDLIDADTYARVAVARLRKTLTSYFASHPDEEKIYVDNGSYEILIRGGDAPVATAGKDAGSPSSSWHRLICLVRKYKVRYILACLAIVALSVSAIVYNKWQSHQRWTESDFPTLSLIHANEDEAGRSPEVDQDVFRNVLRTMLADYFGFRLIEPGRVQADYEIRLDVDRLGETEVENVSLVESATHRLVWSKQYSITSQADLSHRATQAAVAIAAPGGALNAFGRRKGLSSQSPYGCWLRFTESIMSYSSTADDDLYSCAQEWHATDDASRTAAFLRNWTMVDASVTTISESRRRAELEAALTVVHRALARNPDNGMLYISEMRTYSFLGMRDAVRQSARSAIEAAPENRVIAGMAGTWLTFWNDPAGPDILAELDATPQGSLPWEHAGHFVAAMMVDDVQSAGHHLTFLRFYMEDQPALSLLEAAYARRIGRQQAAEAALDRLRNHPRSWIAGPDEIMQRMPLAPEVKARLAEWIAYDTTPAGRNRI